MDNTIILIYTLLYNDVNDFSSSASSVGIYVQHGIMEKTVDFFFRFDFHFCYICVRTYN